MESEEQWSDQDFIQIAPQLPEETEENWEDSEEQPFSFQCPASGGAHEDGGGEGRHCHDEHGNEKLDEQGLQEEFEFSNIMSTSASSVVECLSSSGISPADDLFFKGQLLPLHLPPRIQMVKQLVLGKQHQEQQQHEPPVATSDMRNIPRNEENIGHVHAAMNALSIARIARLFQPMYSKFCNIRSTNVVSPTPAHLGNSWWDPRDSHAHEYSSAGSFTSTDLDSFGDSSSSRDSNGSSQDCFDSNTKHHFHTSDSKGFLHNREVSTTHSALSERSSGISTWLRPSFKWRVLSGADNSSTTTSKPSAPCDVDVQPRAHSMEAPSEFFPTSPVSTDRYYSDCSGELSHSGDLRLSSRALIHGGDMEKYRRGRERARGYLQRYMKALNPNRSKDQHHSQGLRTDEGTTRASPAIAPSKIFPPVSQSSKFSPKDISLRMKRPRLPSPLPGPRRVSTISASSDLHSAIQGAIAHCKESEKQHNEDDDLFDLKCVDQNIL